MKSPRTILITGASSGIGKALAEQYSAPGVTLYLQGRNEARLKEVADSCRAHGAAVHNEILDVTDATGMERWMIETDATTPIDLIIANAGVSAGTGIHGETGTQVRHIYATNIDGVVNTVQPLLARMVARQRGQIAIMSSLASLRGLPSCPAYSSSKACVRAYGEGLRGWLAASHVQVSVVCPGYIQTPMTDTNHFPMPLIMSPQKAARIIARGLANNKGCIAFPRMIYYTMLFVSLFPLWLTDPLFAALPAKPASPSE